MKDGIFIGIDAGTSVIKSIAFTTNGEQLGSTAIPNAYETLSNGGVEQDMARTWGDAAATLRELAEKIPNLKNRVIAISVTGQGDGTWLIDKAGEPVAPAFLWLDARAAAIAEEFVASRDHEAHYRRTGTGVNACQTSTHLVWLKRNAPEILQRAATSFHCKDWLYFKLTGVRATDPSEANFTFGEYRSRTYAPYILDTLGASEAKRLLPPIVEGTETAHALSEMAANACGLKTGTPVVLGYVDVVCTGVGGGLYDPKGEIGCTIAGSTGMHMRIAPDASRVRLNSEMSGYTMAFPVPGMYAQMQSNMASTLNIDWLLSVAIGILKSQGVQRSPTDLLKGLDDSIMKAPAGRVMYHPYISRAGERGPFLDPNARAMFSGLEIGIGYPHLMRAVFEGLCMAARECYAAMGDIPKEVRITGGAARSAALRLMLASTLNSDVRTVSRQEAGAAGAAMMAAIQQKVFASMDECASVWVTPALGSVTKPDASLAATYQNVFANYAAARRAMQPIWRAMRHQHSQS
jgi:erythritol kinase (D-erythritol 1-phosphate-forming)